MGKQQPDRNIKPQTSGHRDPKINQRGYQSADVWDNRNGRRKGGMK